MYLSAFSSSVPPSQRKHLLFVLSLRFLPYPCFLCTINYSTCRFHKLYLPLCQLHGLLYAQINTATVGCRHQPSYDLHLHSQTCRTIAKGVYCLQNHYLFPASLFYLETLKTVSPGANKGWLQIPIEPHINILNCTILKMKKYYC